MNEQEKPSVEQGNPSIPERSDNMTQNTQCTPVVTQKPKYTYTVKEGVFALLSFVFAYCFIDFCLFTGSPGIATFVLVCGFAAIVVSYQLINRIKFTLRSIVCLVLLLASGATLFIFDGDLYVITFLLDMMLGMYWLFITLGGTASVRFDYLAWFDALKSLFILPFVSFGRGFAAVFSLICGKNTDSKKKHRVLFAFLGILIAVIPCSIVIDLLIKDEAFKSLLENIFSFDGMNIGETIAKIILAIPVSCYLFSAIFSATRDPKKKMLSYEETHSAAKEVRVFPIIMVCSAITPLLIVYLLYFFSQTAYFVSAFSNILPDGYTYAEYARSGFFELCRVSVVNLIVIAIAEIFSRFQGKKPVALKIYISILSVFTLALMAIAQSKLAMYIRTYGMTPLRVNTFWFSLVLGILFLFILLYQFLPKINFTRCAAISCAVMFCALIFADTDAMIARYNIEQYKSGVTYSLDTDLLLWQLSDSAVPVIIDEYDSLPYGKEKVRIHEYYTHRAEKLEKYGENSEDDWREWDLSSHRAKRLIIENFGTK